MDCKCMRVDERFWIVDDKCVPPMHRTLKRRYSEGGDMAVPDGSMFDLNIFLDNENGAALIFDCGCEAHFHPDGSPFSTSTPDACLSITQFAAVTHRV